MKRLLLVPVLVAALTALSGAKKPAPSPTAERARQLHRDRKLVDRFVKGGLDLARTGTDDPLQRARYCNGVAEDLAAEIEVSLQDGDTSRVDLLGRRFHKLVIVGVAPNLGEARRKFPAGSTDERRVLDLGENNLRRASRLESKLRRAGADSEEVQGILRAVTEARAEVQRALPSPPRKN